MSRSDAEDSDSLVTPIHLKTHAHQSLPTDEAAFLLASNGIFMLRNHEFFVSSAKARTWPRELARHESSLQLRHPKIPQAMLERIVGFFDAIAERDNCEAGVLLAWDRQQPCIKLLVPRQVATVGVSWDGRTYPIGLHYETPCNLPVSWSIIGDVHSHVYDAAYSSAQDQNDEEHRTGLHLVIGRLDGEPPEFHAEYVVDGERFKIDPHEVLVGYQQRNRHVPQRWLRKVRTQEYSWSTSTP